MKIALFSNLFVRFKVQILTYVHGYVPLFIFAVVRFRAT